MFSTHHYNRIRAIHSGLFGAKVEYIVREKSVWQPFDFRRFTIYPLEPSLFTQTPSAMFYFDMAPSAFLFRHVI